MQWIIILCGLALLLLAVILTYWLHGRMAATQNAASPYCRLYRRTKLPRKALRLLRHALREADNMQDEAILPDSSRRLMESILRIQREAGHSPAMPGCEDNEPRLMALAREIADTEQVTPDALLDALSTWDSATPGEAATLPLCVMLAQSDRLTSALQAILRDAEAQHSARRLARRMHRSKAPLALLEKSSFSAAGLFALLSALRDGDHHELFAAVEEWLTSRDTSTKEIIHHATQRRVRIAEEIRRTLHVFESLSRMEWLTRCGGADSVHHQLLEDPAGIYPKMDAASRYALRLQVEKLSRKCRLDAEVVLQQALRLSTDAETHSLESYIGYWFQDAKGLRSLSRSLPTKRGRLYARFALRQETLSYAGLWGFGVIAGFLFLQGRHPVFMLPFFALTVGGIARNFLSGIGKNLPSMDISTMSADLRTLVVIPAVLRDPHEAIRMVRRMKIARNAFPEDHVSFMLLGDFGDNMTAVSSADAAIIHAASSAIAALEDSSYLYLQRARTWDGDRHVYSARGGQQGAIREICRLIAQGECTDVIAHASVEAAQLERQYAYVLVLQPNSLPAPGMLTALLQRMVHPLSMRYPTGHGWRGYAVLSPEGDTLFDGVGLIRPDAYLEATDGVADSAVDAEAVTGELAGHAGVVGASCQHLSKPDSWDAVYLHSLKAWRMSRWQLPYVQTPSGLIANPLGYFSRFRLREMLRDSLVPLGQLVLLIWAVLTDSWLLLALALLAPEASRIPRNWKGWLSLGQRLSFLPTRAFVHLRGLVDAFRRYPEATLAWNSLEIWTQWLTATLLIALGLALPHMTIPALALGLLFGCYPWMRQFSIAPLLPSDGLTEEQSALLEDIAAKTWRYFTEHVTADTGALPPISVQFEPPLGKANETSPEAIGAYLLSCICAKDLGFLNANAAAARIRPTLEATAKLSLPFGLPCRRYDMASMTVPDASSDAASVGVLLAALMTTAQALRSWLPEMSAGNENLSAVAENIAASFDLSRLYDSEANTFHRGLDQNGQPVEYIDCFSDEALLLSVAACARRIVPPAHFSALRQPATKWHGTELHLSRHGNASAHLLAWLFLPGGETAAQAYLQAMLKHGQDGLWGQDECSYYGFDAALRYRQARFGVTEAALSPGKSSPVYTPYAAALCLPFAPHLAAEALLQFKAHGALGPLGMCDAVDLTTGDSLVGVQDAFHQGLMLIAAAHLLADSPVRRYFCDLPEVEACLPLLVKQPSLILPPLPARRSFPPAFTTPERTADLQVDPAEAHLLGSKEFHLITTAHGHSLVHDGDIPLTHWEPLVPANGIQFYVTDEGRTYWLGDASLPRQVIFAPGEVRSEILCGSLKAELICTVDTVRRRTLHVLTITNLSTRDRIIEAADCLLPDLNTPASTLEAIRPARKHLTLQARGQDRALHHAITASQPELAISACSDALAFIGRGRTLENPASLAESPQDMVTSTVTPCLSFRVKLALGGRGQATLWFTTSTEEHPAPTYAELSGIRRLAAMQHEAIDNAASLTDTQAQAAHLLVAFMQGRNQLSLTLNDLTELPTLLDLVCIAGWFALHGHPLNMEVLCSQTLIPPVKEAIQGQLAEDMILFADAPSFPNALALQGGTPLLEQLLALQRQRPIQPSPARRPVAALLPKLELDFPGLYGGFHPETGTYVIQLEPGQTTPAPWTNTHTHAHYHEKVDESGIRTPFEEKVILRLADGTELSPWSVELPRTIRMDAGLTSWETWSDSLDVRLCASAMPGHRCGLRMLRVRNATEASIDLRILVQSRLTPQELPLECAPGIVMTQHPAGRMHAYLAGQGWHARRMAYAAAWELPDDPDGRIALLEYTMTLLPNTTQEALWLSGYARHAEDVALALHAFTDEGASTLLHRIRAHWAQELGRLTVSTPEESLDQLMNHILPLQAIASDTPERILILNHLNPHEAKRTLLKTARHAHSREDWAQLAWLTKAYVQITGDASVLDVHLAFHDATFYEHCAQELLSLPKDPRGLPLGKVPARTCFMMATATQALDSMRPNPELQEFARKLLNAADTYLWQDGYYGEPLRLDVQHMAYASYGATPRTRQAVRTAWMTLYDRPHGLIKAQEATDIPPLPGLPENGGMVTADAACFLRALLKTDRAEDAHELLQALNPIHHTDDPLRLETFRCAPYQLHGGMYASPMDAGQAAPEGGDSAAALLYDTVLQDVLGFQRHGNIIRIDPHVPPDWEDYTITLQEGASTWHISVERRTRVLTIDGDETDANTFTIEDDGRVHQIRAPLD